MQLIRVKKRDDCKPNRLRLQVVTCKREGSSPEIANSAEVEKRHSKFDQLVEERDILADTLQLIRSLVA